MAWLPGPSYPLPDCRNRIVRRERKPHYRARGSRVWCTYVTCAVDADGRVCVSGGELGDQCGVRRLKRGKLRAVAGGNEEQAAGRAQHDGTKQKKGERDAVNQFPAAQAQRDRRQTQHEIIILAHKRIAKTPSMGFDAMQKETERESLIVEGCERPATWFAYEFDESALR